MEINIYQIDAFTNTSFGGNPAGVVPDSRFLTEDEMQLVAKEMNLSETAFLTQLYEDFFHVRFFTPEREVDLCGHATIGAFYTMASKGYIKPIDEGSKIVFQKTKAGKLGVELIYKDGKIDKVFMDQAEAKSYGRILDLEELAQAMGIDPEDIGHEEIQVQPEIISTGLLSIMVPVKSKEILDNLKVDLDLIRKISKDNKAVGIHAFYLPEIDSKTVYTRNFAPILGIDEESATGTSNGALMYFLKKEKLTSRDNILAYQGESIDRPSEIFCRINGDKLVQVGGRAKLMLDGIMCL